MYYVKKKKGDLYLHDTVIENVFINELLSSAPGDYIKVYLYGAMYAQAHCKMTDKIMSRELDILETDVKKAWKYWEDLGIVKLRKNTNGEKDIIFLSIKEQLFGSAEDDSDNISYYIDDSKEEISVETYAKEENEIEEKNEKTIPSEDKNITSSDNRVFVDGSADEESDEKELQKFMIEIERILGRPLDTSELRTLLKLLQEDDISKDLIEYGFKYGSSKGKNNFRYVEKIIENWVKEGLMTPMEVESNNAKYSERQQEYKQVLKFLGLYRQPTEEEAKIMDKWFDEFGYNLDKIQEACSKTSGISSPNINYVNKVLENWYSSARKTGRSVNANKAVSQKVLDQYFEYLRKNAKKEQRARIEEVYKLTPEIKTIDEEINRLGVAMSRGILNNDSSDNKGLADKISRLEDERAILLLESNKSIDYTDIRYKCVQCQDTGMTDGGTCACVKERIDEAGYWAKERSVIV